MKSPVSTDPDFLRDLAERLMAVPVLYGVDQGDVDRLLAIARQLEALCKAHDKAHMVTSKGRT
jgi:hypothetical protein